jgi:hypothetical protein
MNLKTLPSKLFVAAIAGAVCLSPVVFSAAAQSAGGTDFTPFQIIGQRNIFDPNRVPHVRSGARSNPRIVDSFSFVGTMSYAKGTFAFFDGTSPDFRKVLELDGGIAGFKVAAITPKSVTLQSGTNETIMPLGTQMRRDDDGHWVVSTDTASYAGLNNASGSDRRSSNRRHFGGSPDFSAVATDNSQSGNSNAAAPGGVTGTGTDVSVPNLPGGAANDALTRLMRQRAQEEQQLGQGSGQ